MLQYFLALLKDSRAIPEELKIVVFVASLLGTQYYGNRTKGLLYEVPGFGASHWAYQMAL